LRDAAIARRRIRLYYTAASEEHPKTRTVDPYGLVENAGRWYLVAAHRGQRRSYRVSRIDGVRVLEEEARLPERIDLQEEWDQIRTSFEQSSAAVEVRVAVEPTVLDTFRMIATGQSASGRPPGPDGVDDGWPILVVTVRAWLGAVALVLGFGGQVRLLAPDALIHDVVERARATLAMHTMGA
jgi:predicted DNA-binding transcriptional regulator YafY